MFPITQKGWYRLHWNIPDFKSWADLWDGQRESSASERQVSHFSLPGLWKRVFSNFEDRFWDKASKYTMLYYIKIK